MEPVLWYSGVYCNYTNRDVDFIMSSSEKAIKGKRKLLVIGLALQALCFALVPVVNYFEINFVYYTFVVIGIVILSFVFIYKSDSDVKIKEIEK